MIQKEISNFSYGILAVVGAAGLLFSLLSPNGSVAGAAVSAFFVVLGAGSIIRNSRKKKANGDEH